MAVQEIEVFSLGDLVDRVTPAEPDPVTARRRYSGVYHGSAHAHAPLLTSLDRLGGVSPPHTKVQLEEHILRNFIRNSRPYLSAEWDNEWELLVIAQHHGVPTRLLDWSYSPLVALHFALRKNNLEDRVVWRLDWRQMHRAFGFAELAMLIRDLMRMGDGEAELTPWALFRDSGPERPFALMLDPPSISTRIVAQAGVFTLTSTTTTSFDQFLESHGLADALTRFIIPADRVALFRDQLDLVGMDERRLFPDLDGVATQMRRYYS